MRIITKNKRYLNISQYYWISSPAVFSFSGSTASAPGFCPLCLLRQQLSLFFIIVLYPFILSFIGTTSARKFNSPSGLRAIMISTFCEVFFKTFLACKHHIRWFGENNTKDNTCSIESPRRLDPLTLIISSFTLNLPSLCRSKYMYQQIYVWASFIQLEICWDYLGPLYNHDEYIDEYSVLTSMATHNYLPFLN